MSRRPNWAVQVATCGGLGSLTWPGLWGSAVGFLLGLALAAAAPRPLIDVLIPAGFVLCAWICDLAEHELDRHDPLSVILDEVWAMAAILLFMPWALLTWPRLIAAFVLFRIFDVLKPPPLNALARLRGGWGIMADDAGAAGYTIAVLALVRVIA
jgi:phosphatidylglycerophosphatase A